MGWEVKTHMEGQAKHGLLGSKVKTGKQKYNEKGDKSVH